MGAGGAGSGHAPARVDVEGARAARATEVRDAVLVGAVAALLGAAFVGVPSLWLDEVVTHNVVDRPWAGTLAVLGRIDAVHGLYYLLLHAWTDVLGASPVALRLPSALAVGAAAAATVRVGYEVAGRRVGVLAGLVLAVLPSTTWVAGEARSGALAMAAVTWATWAALRAVRGAGPWWRYSVLVALAGLVSLTSLTVLVAHAVTGRGAGVRAPAARAWVVASAAGLLPVVPLLLVAAGQRAQVGWIERPGPLEVVGGVLVVQWFPEASALAALAWPVLLAVVLRPRWFPDARSGRPVDAVRLAVPWAAVPTVLLLGVSFVAVPLWVPRYLHPVAPAVALLLAVAVAALRPRVVRVAALVAVAALAAGAYAGQRAPTGHHASDWAGAALVVADRARPGDAVLVAPDRPVFSPRRALEAYGDAFEDVEDVGLAAPMGADHPLFTVGAPPATAVARVDGAARVWVLADRTPDADPTLDALARRGWRGEEVWAGPTTRVLLLRATP